MFSNPKQKHSQNADGKKLNLPEKQGRIFPFPKTLQPQPSTKLYKNALGNVFMT